MGWEILLGFWDVPIWAALFGSEQAYKKKKIAKLCAKAKAAQGDGKLDEALEFLEKAVRYAEENWMSGVSAVEIHRDLAELHAVRKDQRRAGAKELAARSKYMSSRGNFFVNNI